MAAASSSAVAPSKKRKEGYFPLDMNDPDYLYSFYRFAEMDKWSDDCVQRILKLSRDLDTHGQEVCRVFHRVVLYYKVMEQDIAECGDQLQEEVERRAAKEKKQAEPTASSAASVATVTSTISREDTEVVTRTETSVASGDQQPPTEDSNKMVDGEEDTSRREEVAEKASERPEEGEEEDNSSSSSEEESDDEYEVEVVIPEPKIYEVITIDSESEDGELAASESTQSVSGAAGDHPTSNRLTEAEAHDIFGDISKQILQLNTIKMFAFNSRLVTGPIIDPMPALTCFGTPSLFFLESEIQRVNTEAANFLRELEKTSMAGNSYEVVSVKQVLVEITRIWKSLDQKRAAVQVKIERVSPEPREQPVRIDRRPDSPIARDRTPKEVEKRHRHGSPTLRHSRDRVQRSSGKRRRHDSSDQSPRRNKSKHRSDHRRRHSRDADDQPSTSEGRRWSEESSKKWCSFCDQRSFHRTIDCNIYASFGARKKRKNDLGLCNHCLEPYNPQTCIRPEHRKVCHICRKHTSNPALCKFRMQPHPV